LGLHPQTPFLSLMFRIVPLMAHILALPLKCQIFDGEHLHLHVYWTFCFCIWLPVVVSCLAMKVWSPQTLYSGFSPDPTGGLSFSELLALLLSEIPGSALLASILAVLFAGIFIDHDRQSRPVYCMIPFCHWVLCARACFTVGTGVIGQSIPRPDYTAEYKVPSADREGV